MNHQFTETATESSGTEDLKLCREELLENARHLDHFGKRFERFMSMQLQKLELSIDRFEREKEAWRRQCEREQLDFTTTPRTDSPSVASDEAFSKGIQKSLPCNANSTAPLLLLVEPGQVSAMQLGLLLFEISKMNREFGGGGVRFEVNTVRLPKRINKRTQPQPVIGIEAFSFIPLLSYDGSPTRELESWEIFKSKVLMSSLLDKELLKTFKKSTPAPRDHDSLVLAYESTLRAENANTKCDLNLSGQYEGFLTNKKDQQPKQQQLQRVEDVFRYLNNEYGLRMHMSLVW